MNFYFGKAIQDGALGPEVGRIVIFEDFITHSNGPSRDHNDLLRSLAAKYRLPKDEVISKAIRLYWKPCKDGIIISPVRKIDDDEFYRYKDLHVRMLSSDFS
jgi:hypothetical protein